VADSLETLQARRDALKQAIDSGQVQVSYTDKSVRYRSLNEMWSVLRQLDEEIATAEGRTRRRQVRMVTRSGW
jgi:hypothetical protein